jgi:hypothetical protein
LIPYPISVYDRNCLFFIDFGSSSSSKIRTLDDH